MFHPKDHPNQPNETAQAYMLRLEKLGLEEMCIRAATRAHFQLSLEEVVGLSNALEEARMRHLALLYATTPNRTDWSMARKFSGNIGISQAEAEKWVRRYKASSDGNETARRKT